MLNKINIKHTLLLSFFAVMSTALHPIFDNRFLPLFTTRLPRLQGRRSRAFIDMFAMQGKKAYIDHFNVAEDASNDEVPLPEMCGKYNLGKLNNSMNKVGKSNPLFLDPWYKISDIIWNMNGKITAQGFNFGWEQNFCTYFTAGIQSAFIHCSSDQQFVLSNDTAEELSVVVKGVDMEGQRVALNRARSNANKILGIEPSYWDKTSLGDTSISLRIGKNWNYVLKCRNIDVGFTLGGIIPTAAKRDINNPASIPLGGNGHPGIFYKLDGQLELKEDWFVGCWVELIHRFSKTQCHRMPLDNENLLWGVLTGQAKVSPGFTWGISPWASLEDAANGWGVMGRFTIIHHQKDNWTDERTNTTFVPQLQNIEGCSSWNAAYASLSIMYDGFREWGGGVTVPRFYFNADIPVGFLNAKGSAITYKFTLGFELSY